MGVTHCDLKPENVLYNSSHNEIKLIDFGHAIMGKYSNAFPGTEMYAPPEYLSTMYCHPIQTTIWTLGLILYEITHGMQC